MGTLVWMAELVTLSKVAAVPLKVTPVAPFRLFPRTMTFDPTLPEVGFVSTKGASPTPTLNAVPHPWLQMLL